MTAQAATFSATAAYVGSGSAAGSGLFFGALFRGSRQVWLYREYNKIKDETGWLSSTLKSLEGMHETKKQENDTIKKKIEYLIVSNQIFVSEKCIGGLFLLLVSNGESPPNKI